MRVPNLVATPVAVERQVQADERKGDTYRRPIGARMLGRISVDGELVQTAELGDVLPFETEDLPVEPPALSRSAATH